MKILIIEDNAEIVESVRFCFARRWPGVEVISASTGGSGLQVAKVELPDFIILDLGLPDRDGLDILPEIRSFSNAPLIILTARGDESDKVRGLELGADDYVVKPFSPSEFLSRVRAVLRRSHVPVPASDTTTSPRRRLTIDYRTQRVFIDGKPVPLAPSAYRLLYHLASNEGKLLSEQTLLENLLGKNDLAETDYIKVYITHLRDKLEIDPKKPKMIVGEPGSGYKFVSQE
ncbi:MAG: response regulator transcription factor [Chloroflexi bacterium]|nr:response regulator transcription factor [Chloroflexota bacterium]